ncbi:MAG: hypothetical protein HUU50_22070 [Candidatus Brocadiae bacterium]|nr:hypothetical protein [Candidatus Brocadiia bacterium]
MEGIISCYSRRFGDQIIQKILCVIDDFNIHRNIYFHFAKMEIEAWFLAVPQLFISLHPALTLENLEQATGKNWEKMNPETKVQNFANEIKRILSQLAKRTQRARPTLTG